MLINIIEVASCENPNCTEFARLALLPRNVRSYYCPTCHGVNPVRGVDSKILETRSTYAEYLKGAAEQCG